MSYCLLINTSFKPWYLVPSYSHRNSCWSLSSILALFRYLFFPIFNFLALQLFTLFHNSYLFNLLWEILGMKSRGKAKNCTEMGSYFLLINWKFQNSSSTPPMNYYYVNSVYLKVHQLWVVALQTHLNYQGMVIVRCIVYGTNLRVKFKKHCNLKMYMKYTFTFFFLIKTRHFLMTKQKVHIFHISYFPLQHFLKGVYIYQYI